MQRDDWRTIRKCPDYEINSVGEVRNKKSGKSLRHTIAKPNYGGYSRVTLHNEGRLICLAVHREVAIAFLGEVEGKPHVHHIDGDKQNNDVSNLMWVSRAEHGELHKGRKYRSRLQERRKLGTQ